MNLNFSRSRQWRRHGRTGAYASREGAATPSIDTGIEVTKLTEKNYLRTLENAVRFGRWVLMENVLETLDASLEPLLLQQTFVQGGTKMIKIGDSTIPCARGVLLRSCDSCPSHDDVGGLSDRVERRRPNRVRMHSKSKQRPPTSS